MARMNSREAPVVKSALALLHLRGIVAWRQNSGVLRNPKGRPVRFGAVGLSDIGAVLPGGLRREVRLMATYVMEIPGWRPATKNDLMKKHNHWAGGAKRKNRDFDVIAKAMMVYGVRPAEGKRRVSILYRVPHPRWFPDPDAMYPSLLDALKRNGALIDDSDRWCEPTKPEFAVGSKSIMILIEDIEETPSK